MEEAAGGRFEKAKGTRQVRSVEKLKAGFQERRGGLETSGGGNLEKPIVFGEVLTLEKKGVNCHSDVC